MILALYGACLFAAVCTLVAIWLCHKGHIFQ